MGLVKVRESERESTAELMLQQSSAAMGMLVAVLLSLCVQPTEAVCARTPAQRRPLSLLPQRHPLRRACPRPVAKPS